MSALTHPMEDRMKLAWIALAPFALAACAEAPPPPAAAADPHAAQHGAAPHWAYAGEGGPPAWGQLAPGFAACKTGQAQTPIDLHASAPKGKLSPIAFDYKPAPLLVRNNGHTIQVDNTAPSSIVVGPAPDDKYDLAQFHFHTPSEHSVDGKLYDGELHFVHKNAAGKLAVVGVLLKKGAENPILAPIWKAAPAELTPDAVPVAGVTIDIAKLLPAQRGYFTYSGSLTTPPCTEGVRWFVLAQPQEISEAQLTRFRELTHGPTNRPVQPDNGRQVQQFVP
jgi:carbonic anhydrase